MNMNASHVHLILNHFPLIGILAGLFFLILFVVKKNEIVLTISLTIFILTGLITIPTYISGEGSEEVLEHIREVSEDKIEQHEELAEKALIAVEVVVLLSIVLFIMKRNNSKYTTPTAVVVILLAAGTFIFLIFVNNTGARIRHPEIQEPNSIKIKIKPPELV